MSTVVTMYDASYQAGRITGQLVMATLVVALIVWAIRASRRKPAPPVPVRTPEGDLASLATVLTLQMAPGDAVALVSHVLAGHPHVVPASGPAQAWSIGGGHPILTVVQSPAGAVLRVQEVELPLVSPEAAVAWEWVLGAVEHEARRSGVPAWRAQQRLTQARPTGVSSAIWAAVD